MATPTTQLNQTKADFMLQFLLNARLAGRSSDVDSDHERQMIVDAAGDLYDKVVAKCSVEVKEDD